MDPLALQSRRVNVEDSFDAIQDYCWEQGWTDGLPVVPPTEDLVRKMLMGYGENPSASLGIIQPRNAQVTLEKVAVNAVMAGCQPSYFPVVVAAVKAVMKEEFNVAGVSSTTGGGTPVSSCPRYMSHDPSVDYEQYPKSAIRPSSGFLIAFSRTERFCPSKNFRRPSGGITPKTRYTLNCNEL